MTQQQVADFLNVNRSTYSYYENGKAEPSITVLIKMADLFNVTLDSLLNMEKNRNTSLDQKCSRWAQKWRARTMKLQKTKKSAHFSDRWCQELDLLTKPSINLVFML